MSRIQQKVHKEKVVVFLTRLKTIPRGHEMDLWIKSYDISHNFLKNSEFIVKATSLRLFEV